MRHRKYLTVLFISYPFDFNNTQKSYEFQIKDDLMIFTYSESNQEIIEDWRKKK